MSTTNYDLVLYGATGFTGRQAAAALSAHRQRSDFRFAIAGRSADKLESLAADVEPDGVIVADGLDAGAVDTMVRQTRVVATTAGPFAKYGDELVRSCAEHGVHYADITGETPWVKSLIDRFHEAATKSGARIVPFCGYDSVPSDLGALFAIETLREKTGQACRQVHAFHRGRGGINGGTVASLLNLQREGRARELGDLFLLNPEGHRPTDTRRHRDPIFATWNSKMGGWAAPFLMSAINSRVVRRSHALLAQSNGGYGPDFAYQEFWLSPGPLGWFESGTMAGMQAMTGLFTRVPGATSLLERVAPAPGTGPSEKTMDSGFFSCDLVATGVDGATVRVQLKGQGDPGNRITVKCLTESALALALDGDGLPEIPGGLLTPATALGVSLVPRLAATGIRFEVGEVPSS